jgi:protein-tyrosine phosphatase
MNRTDDADMISVLFVCLGNICRSPLAEAVFRAVVAEAGLEDRFRIDSAGTSGYHDGEPPDRRTTAVAAGRGVTVGGRSRRITRDDAHTFQYLVVMDGDNRRAVRKLAESSGSAAEVRLFREFDPEADGELDVPDPYFGGEDGFEVVHDLVERSARGLLDHLRERHDL